MKVYNAVIHDEKPEVLVFWETSVDENLNIQQVEVEDSQTGKKSKKWQSDVHRYEYREYIEVLNAKSAELEQQTIQAQIGITEVYEMMLGGQ